MIEVNCVSLTRMLSSAFEEPDTLHAARKEARIVAANVALIEPGDATSGFSVIRRGGRAADRDSLENC